MFGKRRKPESELRNAPLNLRITKTLRAQLRDAAASNGRTVSTEAETRLRRSFESRESGTEFSLSDQPPLSQDAYACLQLLSKMGRYGSSATEVARYLILRELDDLSRCGVLPRDSLLPFEKQGV
jgi:hypothetical protein